ncbi:MAG: ACT domain-containing protein, partial [Nanoarchaeota archaeon]|nr:ACT domain-containing protein [Nanoarchaeota archaeon]
LINYSALTRVLLPKIQEKNPKANFQSVLITIQRYYDEVKGKKIVKEFKEILKDSELLMKNQIVSITFERNKFVMDKINKISKNIRWDMGDILFFTQGNSEITLVIDKKNKLKLNIIKEYILEEKDNLSILSLREPEKLKAYSKNVQGFLALLTSALSDSHVNIYDISSTYKQIIFVIEEKYLTKAYETLNKLILQHQD